MMQNEHEIVQQVYAAKEDNFAADDFIESYKPFIKAETAKFLKRPTHDQDDELSIAMIAFYEAINQYSHLKGSFLNFASRMIKNRLIDYWRKIKRHTGLVELDAPLVDDEEIALIDTMPEEKNKTEEFINREATVAEIRELAQQMSEFNISLSDVADKNPRQKRTLLACQKAADTAIKDEKTMTQFFNNKKLPITRIAELSQVAKKTLERHRDYIIALLIIYSNGYDLIRNHLAQVKIVKGER
ncbi:MAG TPA: sigma-70 family RNA polymerase sigma factor [Clostridiaceae bacterium]|nr:sigma-70 family RNA polymerase sigma factor [Clostridiaceae bacterium]